MFESRIKDNEKSKAIALPGNLTVYDKVRERIIPVTKELIDLTLMAKDRIKSMLDETHPDEARIGLTSSEIVAAFKKLAPEKAILTPPLNKNFF